MNFINKLELIEESGNHYPRIAIILAQLGGGGIQRMRLNIIDRLVECGYAVDLVVGKGDGPLAECVPEGIPVYTLANEGKIWFFFGLLNYLRKRSPTHVLSSYEDISVMAIASNWLLGSRSYMLISTHSAISQLPYASGWLNFLKYSVLLFPMMRLLYPRVQSLVAVSEGVAVEINEILGVPLETIQVIYNPVIGGNFNSLINEEIPEGICDLADRPLIGFFGRLHPKKRVDTLIRAFALVRKSRQCRLIIVGEGSELFKLQRLAQSLGVASDVVFWGFSKNPFPIMKSCDITVLPSAYEGLGNVLVESLACGVQTISTDCPHGPAEILGNGRWGQLVPVGDVVAMAEAIRKSLDKEFWVEPSILKERGLQFTSIKATDRYLSALKLSKINPKPKN